MSEPHQAPLKITEPDHPNVPLIVLFIVGTITIVLTLIIGLLQYFEFTMRAEVERKQLAPDSTLLRGLRAEEQTKLSRYSWQSQKDGTVRIPLERAIELTLRDWNARPAGIIGFAAAGAPAPAPAPAPTPVVPAPTPTGTAPAPEKTPPADKAATDKDKDKDKDKAAPTGDTGKPLAPATKPANAAPQEKPSDVPDPTPTKANTK